MTSRRSFFKGLAGAMVAGPAITEAVAEPTFTTVDLKADYDVQVADYPYVERPGYLYCVNDDSMRCMGCGEVITGLQAAQGYVHECLKL